MEVIRSTDVVMKSAEGGASSDNSSDKNIVLRFFVFEKCCACGVVVYLLDSCEKRNILLITFEIIYGWSVKIELD